MIQDLNPGREKNYSHLKKVQTGSGALFSAYQGSFSVVKRPGLEIHYLPVYNAQVKNEWK